MPKRPFQFRNIIPTLELQNQKTSEDKKNTLLHCEDVLAPAESSNDRGKSHQLLKLRIAVKVVKLSIENGMLQCSNVQSV